MTKKIGKQFKNRLNQFIFGLVWFGFNTFEIDLNQTEPIMYILIIIYLFYTYQLIIGDLEVLSYIYVRL